MREKLALWREQRAVQKAQSSAKARPTFRVSSRVQLLRADQVRLRADRVGKNADRFISDVGLFAKPYKLKTDLLSCVVFAFSYARGIVCHVHNAFDVQRCKLYALIVQTASFLNAKAESLQVCNLAPVA